MKDVLNQKEAQKAPLPPASCEAPATIFKAASTDHATHNQLGEQGVAHRLREASPSHASPAMPALISLPFSYTRTPLPPPSHLHHTSNMQPRRSSSKHHDSHHSSSSSRPSHSHRASPNAKRSPKLEVSFLLNQSHISSPSSAPSDHQHAPPSHPNQSSRSRSQKKSHSASSGQRRFACEFCSATFAQSHDALKHKRSVFSPINSLLCFLNIPH